MAVPDAVGPVIICLYLYANTCSISGLLGFVVYGTAIIAVEADKSVDPHGVLDWFGAYLGVAALILFNFVWKWVSPDSLGGSTKTD